MTEPPGSAIRDWFSSGLEPVLALGELLLLEAIGDKERDRFLG